MTNKMREIKTIDEYNKFMDAVLSKNKDQPVIENVTFLCELNSKFFSNYIFKNVKIIGQHGLGDLRFSTCQFINVIFKVEASIFDTRFTNCIFDNVQINANELYEVDFIHSGLESITFSVNKVRSCRFTSFEIFTKDSVFGIERAMISSANVIGVTFPVFSEFKNIVELYAINLSKSILIKSTLECSNIVNCNFEFANLTGSTLSYNHIANVSFRNANLRYVTFMRKEIRKYDTAEYAYFTNANLTGANFVNGTLASCNFDEAILDDADFTKVLVRKSCSFENAKIDKAIGLPDWVYEKYGK